MPAPDDRPDPLSAPEVASRAAAGVAVLGARGALIFLLGLGGNLALAGMLAPRDFGLVALGTVVVTVGQFLVTNGLGMAMISRPEDPERSDLAAVLAAQVFATAGLAAVFGAVAVALGGDALVPALMVVSLPITTLRVPAVILLERQLLYRRQATVDVIDALSYYGFAIVAVALGMSVWGMAAAVVVRALAGTAAMLRLAPEGRVFPRWSWARVRPVLGFGARVQGITATVVVRDQGLNVGLAAIGGVGVLGLWTFANRVMQAPFLLFTTLYRVSFPAMSRLIAAREDPRPYVERGTETAAVTAAVLLVPIAGGISALIPAVVGDRWADAGGIIVWSSLGVAVGAPVSIATLGYLLAAGDASVALRGALLQAATWLAVSLSLYPALGPVAIGLGWAGSELVSAAVLGRAAAARTGARVFQRLAAPALLAIAGGAAGWALASSLGDTIPSALAGAAVAEIVLLGGLAVVSPQSLRGTVRVFRRAVRSAAAA